MIASGLDGDRNPAERDVACTGRSLVVADVLVGAEAIADDPGRSPTAHRATDEQRTGVLETGGERDDGSTNIDIASARQRLVVADVLEIAVSERLSKCRGDIAPYGVLSSS